MVEALVLGRDIGFVHVGDHAVVKLEAYPFTRYGTLSGQVIQASPDAMSMKKEAWRSLCV